MAVGMVSKPENETGMLNNSQTDVNNREAYLDASNKASKELKRRLPKEPKLFNNLMRDTLSNGEYEGNFDDKVFDSRDFEPGTTVDPILQDLSNRYPDLKYSELASNPEAFKYYTESRNKRNKRLGGSGETLQGTILEELVDMFKDTYLDNPEKYTKESLEALIENKPEQVLEDPKMPEEAKEEAAQVLDSDARTDEANNEAVERAVDELNNNEEESLEDFEKAIETNPEKAVEDFKDTKVDNKIAEDFIKNAGLLGGRKLGLKGTARERTEAGRKELADIEDDQWKNNEFGIEYVPTKEERAALAEDNRHLPRKTNDTVEDEAEAIVETDEEESVDEEADKIVESAFPAIPARSLGPDVKLSGTDEIERKLSNAGSSFGRAFSHPSAGSGNLSSESKDLSIDKAKPVDTKVSAKANLKSVEDVKSTIGSSRRGIENRTSNGGTFGSGGVNKTGNSLLKVQKVSLPGGESNNQVDLFNSNAKGGENLRETMIRKLEERIKSLPKDVQEHFEFSIKYKHTEYKRTPLDECSGGQLKEVEDILNALGA